MCDFSFIRDITLREACIVVYDVINQLTKTTLEKLNSRKLFLKNELVNVDKLLEYGARSFLDEDISENIKDIEDEMKEPFGWKVFDFDIPTNPYTRIDPATADCYFKKWDVSIGLKRILEDKQIYEIYKSHDENFIYQVLLIMRQLYQTNKKP